MSLIRQYTWESKGVNIFKPLKHISIFVLVYYNEGNC